MKRLFAQLFRREEAPRACLVNLPNLPESVAYSAFLASGVDGVNEVSFAQFLASMSGASQSRPQRGAPRIASAAAHSAS